MCGEAAGVDQLKRGAKNKTYDRHIVAGLDRSRSARARASPLCLSHSSVVRGYGVLSGGGASEVHRGRVCGAGRSSRKGVPPQGVSGV